MKTKDLYDKHQAEDKPHLISNICSMDIYMKRFALIPSRYNSSYPNPLFGGIPDFYPLKISLLQRAENILLQNLPNELLLAQLIQQLVTLY